MTSQQVVSHQVADALAPTAGSGSDPAPKDLYVGCINPRALTEVLLGRKVDWNEKSSVKLMTDTLQTDYNELFDMKYNSPLYAGLKLQNGHVVKLPPAQIEILEPHQRATPDLMKVKKLQDLQSIGVDDFANLNVENAVLENGKLTVKLDVPSLNNTITNASLTQQIFGITIDSQASPVAAWTAPNCHWQDIGNFMKDVTEFDSPVQGALGDCWLIAALSAVAWSLPYSIDHRTRPTSANEVDHVDELTFYGKGYGRDAPTGSVEVTDDVVVTNSGDIIVYCRSNNIGEMWPAVYEKAFAKWTTGNTTDEPNITTLTGGDPALATAQLTNRQPVYYDTASRSADDLWTIVRANSLSYRTFNPMTAWTYATGNQFNGINIAANHAYTILGWAFQNNKKYIVLRNPWGYWEPNGLNSYQGILQFFDESFWLPINMIPDDGIFALEADAFKLYYVTIGVASP